MTDIGRNNPCPCGSGLKYKKCCLPKEETPAAAARPRQTARDTVMPKLLRFAGTSQFDADQAIADRLFWSDRLDALTDEDAEDLVASEDAEPKYNAWFLWDLEIEDGVTVSDLFLEQRGRSIDSAERAFVERMRECHLRLYQIEAVDAGRGVTLRDLWTKRTLFVHERLGSDQLVRWDVVAARVIAHLDDAPVFEGGLYLYPASDKTDLLRILKRYHRAYVKRFPESTLNDFFKRHGFIFNHLWLDRVVARPMPKMVTAEGDEMMFTRSVFDVADPQALRAALEAREDVDATEDGALIWLEETEDLRRMLGTFRLDGTRLTLETTSRPRAERGRTWLEAAAPGLTSYRATELETVAQAIAKAGEHPTEPNDEIPADVRASIEREMMDRHYRKWLDEPIPALKGSTPRQAAASRRLKPLLVDLLRELTNRYEHSSRRGEPGYDPVWLWSELGVKP
jgi:hypothetical protein